MKTIYTLPSEFVRQHRWLFAAARHCGVALCGGCAAAIIKQDKTYEPKDIDLVATHESAIALMTLINDFMLRRSVHFRIYGNSRNGYVPKPAVGHFRITNPFWLPVCLFILPEEQLKVYRIKGGHFLQIYSQIKKAADDLTETDGKERSASQPPNQPEDLDIINPTAIGSGSTKIRRLSQ